MSKPFMISYDLNAPGQNYEKVKDVITNFGGAYIKLQKSFWLVRNDLTADEMARDILNVVDKNDSIFVCELNNDYQGNTTQENWDFIRENIFSE